MPHDACHEASRHRLARHAAGGGLLVALVLLLPEVAGALARRTGDPRLARRAVGAVPRLPGLRLLAVDEALGRMAATLAGRIRLRGAVSVAAAATLGLPLVTRDGEPGERAGPVAAVVRPGGGPPAPGAALPGPRAP